MVARPDPRAGVHVCRRVRHRLGRWRRTRPPPRRRGRRPDARRTPRPPPRPGRRAALPRPAVPPRAGHRPRHRGGRQLRPRPAALRAHRLARGRPHPQLPAVLRDQLAHRDPGRGRRVVRPLARRDPPLVRRGPGRRPARRPPRRPARPRQVPRRPRRPDRWGVRRGREDPRVASEEESGRRRSRLAGGTAADLGDRRHHRVRGAGADRPRPGRPGRRGAADHPGGAPPRTPHRLAGAGPRRQAGRGRGHPELRGPPDRPRGAGRPRRERGRDAHDRPAGVRGGRVARLHGRLPLLPPRRPRAPRARVRGLAPTASRPHRPLRPAVAGAVRRGVRAGAAVPADVRHGDGQGRRGRRVLPLVAAHVAQRSGRRPGRVLRRRRRLPRADGRPAGALARRADRGHHARHQARRGRPRPYLGARRGTGPVGRVPERTPGPRAPARPGLRQPALAGDPGRVARRPRTPAWLRRKGDARGGRAHVLDGPRRGLRGVRAGRCGRRLRRAPRGCGAAAPRRCRRRARLEQRAGGEAARPDDPGRPRPLSGQRAVGAQPGRPRQSASRRLRAPQPAAGGGAHGGAAAASDERRGRRRRQAAAESPGAHRPARPPRLVHALRHPGRRWSGRAARRRLRPRRGDRRRHPPAGRPRSRRRLGRHRAAPARWTLARRPHRTPRRGRRPRRHAPGRAAGVLPRGPAAARRTASGRTRTLRRLGAGGPPRPALSRRPAGRDGP